MFAVITNRGTQVSLHETPEEAQEDANRINRNGGSTFAWVVFDPNAVEEDLPGRGFLYG